MALDSIYRPLELDHEELGFGIASGELVLVVVWGRDARVEDVQRLTLRQRAVAKQYGRCVTMSIIRAGLSISVDRRVREASAANLRELSEFNRGSVLIVEAGGLRASFFRSIVTGVQMLARTSVPQGVFSDIDEGARWLLEQPGVDSELVPHELGRAARAFADRYGTA